MCFGCSKEPSHWDGPFEYQKHMFWLRNMKILNYTLLTGGLAPRLYKTFYPPTKLEGYSFGVICPSIPSVRPSKCFVSPEPYLSIY